MLGADVLARHGHGPGVLAALAGALCPGGMLLLEEPVGAATDATDAVDGAELAVVSRLRAESREYVLLRARADVPGTRTHAVVDVSDREQFAWVEQLKAALARAEGEGERMRVYAVSRAADCGVLGLASCLRAEPGGRALRVYYLPGARVPFAPDAPEYAARVRLDLAVNVLRGGAWGSYRHLPLAGVAEARLQLEHAYVNTLTRGDLSSLRWVESPLRYASEAPAPPGTELCHVYCAALNFRDVMLATGKLPPDALPGNLAGQVSVTVVDARVGV